MCTKKSCIKENGVDIDLYGYNLLQFIANGKILTACRQEIVEDVY